MTSDRISREALFALVWERPATEVARELGISDVTLGKLCRRLQVPKPPRGYWARVKSGKTPRRPPLKAFRAESRKDAAGRHGHGPGRRLMVQLTQGQRALLQCALDELREGGVDTTECALAYEGVRHISPDLAAQALIVLQNRYEKWVEERGGSMRGITGAKQSVGTLVSKLLPFAREQLVLFRREDRQGELLEHGPAIVVRFSGSLQERIASLHRLVRERGLAHAAMALGTGDHAWSVRYVYWPSTLAHVRTELCVSAKEVWLQCDGTSSWGTGPERYRTDRLSIHQLASVDLLDPKEIPLPPIASRAMLRPYDKRVKALREAEQLYESLVSAAYQLEQQVPDECLALADRLWFGNGGDGPFLSARRAWRRMEEELERWEQAIEAEKAELCRDIAGIAPGDIVVADQQGKAIRVQVESASISFYESTMMLHFYGTRFRKDGLLGKRQEYFAIALTAGPGQDPV